MPDNFDRLVGAAEAVMDEMEAGGQRVDCDVVGRVVAERHPNLPRLQFVQFLNDGKDRDRLRAAYGMRPA